MFKSLQIHDTLSIPGPQQYVHPTTWISSKWLSGDAESSIVELKEPVVSDNTHFVMP